MSSGESRAASLVACDDCDLLQRVPPLPPGSRARCSRCGNVVAAHPSHTLDLPLALALAAVIVYAVAQTAPLMSLSAVGREASTTIFGGAYQMWLEGEPITGAIVFFCVVLAPGLYLAFVIAALVAARGQQVPHWTGELLRLGLHMQPWAMFEVMLLGVLVALIKIAELATVDPGIGMYALGVLVALFPAIAVTFDTREVWRRVEWSHGADDARGLPEAPR